MTRHIVVTDHTIQRCLSGARHLKISGRCLLNSPRRSCFLLEVQVNELLGQILELLKIAGLIDDALKALLLELLMESDFHGSSVDYINRNESLQVRWWRLMPVREQLARSLAMPRVQ